MPRLAPRPRPVEPVRRERLLLADGERTTLHVREHRLDRIRVRVVRLPRPQPLAAWARRTQTPDALVGGFFVREGAGADATPLGELRTSGIARRAVPFDAPWNAIRACVHAAAPGHVAVARRPDLPAAPAGDLLQAGPLLVAHGEVAVAAGTDPEGFSAGSRQFDSDITAGRHPRAALAVTRHGRLLAVAADGRADDEAGLTLAELAEALVALGASHALNLDGGGSTSLVCAGELVNLPREQHGVVLPGGRAVPTALAFAPR